MMRRALVLISLIGCSVLASIPVLAITCPAGFVDVTPGPGLGTLGCVEVDASASAEWEAASQDCFARVGGRLPTAAEWFVVFNNLHPSAVNLSFILSEWTADFTSGLEVATVFIESGVAFGSGFDNRFNTNAYRCFIVPEPSLSLMLPAGAGTLFVLAQLRR